MVYYLMYYWWRYEGAGRDMSFVFFCLAGAVYVLYATAWVRTFIDVRDGRRLMVL